MARLDSNWHCHVTSLSKDVIYEDVCTVGGFSVKNQGLVEPWANMKDMLERLQMRQSILFLSYSFESEVWNERKSVWSLKVSKLRQMWGGGVDTEDLFLDDDQMICLSWLSCWISYHSLCSKLADVVVVYISYLAKLYLTPQLQVISLTLPFLLFCAAGRPTFPCLVAVSPINTKACWHTSVVHLYVFTERCIF